jgi:hypothetical protein
MNNYGFHINYSTLSQLRIHICNTFPLYVCVTGFKITFHASLLILGRVTSSVYIGVRVKLRWRTARKTLNHVRKFTYVCSRGKATNTCSQLRKIILSPGKICDYSLCYDVQVDLSAPQYSLQRLGGKAGRSM